MTKEERKYVDLFCRIKQNDTVIPYEDSMEVMIMPKINRGFYMDHWKSYLASQRRHLGDEYDEWFENLESVDEIEETYRRDLPSKMIEVSYGNEEIFVNEIRNAFVTFMDDIRGLVRPAANTDIGAFYEINPGGFTLAVFSYNLKEDPKAKSAALKAYRKCKDAVIKAAASFSEKQGPNDIKCKKPYVSDGSNQDPNSTRGNMVSVDTAFEGTIYVDEYCIYKSGKGSEVTDRELDHLFKILPAESVQIGAEDQD